MVRTAAYDDPAAVAARGSAEWFMDYRNSDGSLSEMCGNGIRVFARYLVEHEGADPSRPLPVGTRAGVLTVTFDDDALVTVDDWLGSRGNSHWKVSSERRPHRMCWLSWGREFTSSA